MNIVALSGKEETETALIKSATDITAEIKKKIRDWMDKVLASIQTELDGYSSGNHFQQDYGISEQNRRLLYQVDILGLDACDVKAYIENLGEYDKNNEILIGALRLICITRIKIEKVFQYMDESHAKKMTAYAQGGNQAQKGGGTGVPYGIKVQPSYWIDPEKQVA